MIIRREPLIHAFRNFAFAGNGVVIGPPGVGKTYVLKGFCDQLLAEGQPCLYLPIDKVNVNTEAALKAELEIHGDLINFLHSQNRPNQTLPSILVVDAFDAARSESVQKFYLSLIHRVVKELGGLWNVIVSVRTYDAKKSGELLDLFPATSGEAAPEEFQMQDIPCRHFAIPLLSPPEVQEATDSIPALPQIYAKSSSDFKELLRVPFNLWLLERLLALDPNMSGLGNVGSEVQLLGLFWKQRVTDGPQGDDKQALLSHVTQTMVADRSLSIRADQVPLVGANAPWNELLSLEILTRLTTTGQRVAYSHNILFDYAVSVLLIEDEPARVVQFISVDPARPVFLRPSLNFYFTRLWHSEPTLFWTSFWYILPLQDPHLRLFARLLPPSVIANEARAIDELAPLINELAQNNPLAVQATLRLLQALRSLEIQRDELWVDFVDGVSDHLHPEFAMELAMETSSRLDRATAKQDLRLLESCGRISRRLLEWVWVERQPKTNAWFDTLGSRWGIPLVAKTFGSNPDASRRLLQKALDLLQEANFPIQYVYQLSEYINRIWRHDPEFVTVIYRAIFGYDETSQEPTPLGGVVVQLVSNRRQDYDMCRYHLVQHFPQFLRDAPAFATITAIQSLNRFILIHQVIPYLKQGRKVEDLLEQFPFRGGLANYVHDLSYSWAEMSHQREPIKMAHHLYAYLGELATQGEYEELSSALDLFRDNVLVAYFWKRLLHTGAQRPKEFADPLFELCIAMPVLDGNETIHEVGLLIESAAAEFTDEQIAQIEQAILALPVDSSDPGGSPYLERRRNRLLARIPKSRLQSEKAKTIWRAMEEANEVPANEPLVQFSSWTKGFSEEDWLEEQGADVTAPENRIVQDLYLPLSRFESDWQNRVPSMEAIQGMLPRAGALYATLKNPPAADKLVIDAAWTHLASSVETMTRANIDPDSEEFAFCRRILLECAQHVLPLPDPDHDREYNYPMWSPAPRIEAAQALSRLAGKRPDPDLLSTIEYLAHDAVPSVRFLMVNELFRILDKAPEVFWTIVQDLSANEQNPIVLRALSNTIGYAIGKEQDKTISIIDHLFSRAQEEEKPVEIDESLVNLITWLVLVKGNERARNLFEALLAEPIRWASPLHAAAVDALQALRDNSRMDDANREIMVRAARMINIILDAAHAGVKELQAIPGQEWDDSTREKFRDVYNIIETTVLQIYFAADVSEVQTNAAGRSLSDQERKEFYFLVKPTLERIVLFSLEDEGGVLLAPTAHHMMELLNGVLKYDAKGVLHLAAQVSQSSKRFNYNLDALAIGEVTKLVESILADHRDQVRDGQALEDLLNLLDIFAEAGWPEALRLVWRLDEVFR